MQCVQKLFKIDAESPFCIACDRIADGTFDESSGCFDCAPERFSFQNTGSHHRGEEISGPGVMLRIVAERDLECLSFRKTYVIDFSAAHDSRNDNVFCAVFP